MQTSAALDPATKHEVQASRVEIAIERWQYGEWLLDGVKLDWTPPRSNDADADVVLTVERVQQGEQRIGRLHWECKLAGAEPNQAPAAGGTRCEGPLRWDDRPLGELALQQGAVPRLVWREGKRRVSAEFGDGSVGVEWQRLSLEIVQPILTELWPSLQRIEGNTAGRLAWDWQREAASGSLSVDRLGLDAEAGSIALASVPLTATYAWQGLESISSATLALDLAGGEGLLGALYAEFQPGSKFSLTSHLAADSGRDLNLSFVDPSGHSVTLATTLRDEPWSEIDWQAQVDSPDLMSLLQRYLESVLATLGWRDVSMAGALSLQARGKGSTVQHVDLRVDAVDVSAAQPPLQVAGLNGELRWGEASSNEVSTLEWSALSTWGLALGAGRAELYSERGELQLRKPLRLSLHDGSVSLFPLRLAPLLHEFDFGLVLDNVSLGPLSQQFGWPALPGRLSANLPAAHYAANRLSFDGAMDIDVFDGKVSLGSLAMERPFGVAPVFAADIDLQDLDMGPLTSAFGFGEITGRLDGQVAGLRMLDWSPIAFDARLYSDPSFKGKQRISQRAVQDLSSVGGGIIAGLQAQVLKVFENFSYKQLGLNCKLANNVCQMGGIEGEGNGYTVVEGSGLPRITVKGFQRRVDWPVLLKRLRTAVDRGVVVGDGT